MFSLVTAVQNFFNMIFYAKIDADMYSVSKSAVNGAAAGAFFVFLGEAAICVASFFTFFGIL